MVRVLLTRLCLAVFILGAPSLSFAAAETKPSQILAMNTILAELDTHYGMLQFKEAKLGLTLEGLRKKYTKLIQSATTLEEDSGFVPKQKRKQLSNDEFQQLMIGMIAEVQDGHVNLTRLSQEYFTIGIFTAAIDGHLYVTGFNNDLFVPGRAAKDLQVGDEIVAVDGTSVQDWAKQLRLYAQSGTFESRNNMALNAILSRPRAFFQGVKEGATVNVRFRRQDEDFDGQYNWMETRGYRNDREMSPGAFSSELLKAFDQKVPAPFGLTGTVQSYFRTGLNNLELPPGSEYDIGALVNMDLMTAAEKGETSDVFPVKRLLASVVRYNGQNIGLLRIPSYSPGSPQAAANELRWIAEVLRRMENAADVLVIDQVSNSGGYVFYVGALAALLAGDKPLDAITVNMRINETVLNRYSDPSVGNDLVTGKRPNWAQNRLSQLHYENLREKYRAGEKWSGPMAMFDKNTSESDTDQGKIMPDGTVSFTKPILLLNDNRSASGGDFFPALLASNKRAVVMGETSTGLGGPVYRSVDSMTGSEMGFRCTMGYCQRADGLPLEDLGVVPSIVRPVRAADLQNGFQLYSAQVLAAALGLAHGVTVDQIQVGLKPSIEMPDPQSPKVAQSIAELKRFLEAFRDSQVFQLAETDYRAALAKGLNDAYGEVFDAIREVEDSGVPAAAFRGIVVPVPRSLISEDQFLSSLWRREEFASRLGEMANLKAWQKDKSTLEFVTGLRDRLNSVKGDLWLTHPCELLLDH